MSKDTIKRLLTISNHSFFLFGPRGVGKSTFLRNIFPNALHIDLLDSRKHIELSQHPNHLEAMAKGMSEHSWIVIDEIQKIPMLLDEVHRMMENFRWNFALCGSSARKLRSGGTNLLAGRAITYKMESFSYQELKNKFDPDFALLWGTLPLVINNQAIAKDILSAYVNTYIKEEIKEEGVVRNLPPFLRFLEIAGMMNGQILNKQNISREASVPRSNVDVYFSILEDSLLGHFLPAYRPNIKVREQTHPKFYWFDPGVARSAANLLYDPPDQLWLGTSLETLIYHELRVYNHIARKERSIYYYRTSSGVEIDFVIETQKRQLKKHAEIICIEVKSSQKWDRRWEKPMRNMANNSKIVVKKMIGVYRGNTTYNFDGVEVFPLIKFLDALFSGNIF
ncbi:ATPase AAA [Candidatus Magnetomorum sp. HK-1]|nr:ATPase AAA [Candidatus Magnetomorum sp. HK-1]